MSREFLSTYEGLHISDVCTAVRFVDDAQNHCAHFVNHVLGVDLPLTCGQLLGKPGAAANIRVHETFACCPSVGRFDERPTGPCLVFVVQHTAVDLANHRMANVPKKHIGIFCDGDIWHYSNSQRKVVRESPERFLQHFSGAGFGLFFGTFPAGSRAIAVPARTAALANALLAPELHRGDTDNVDVAAWQQFLIIRQLLSGPNIRRLLDGDFGPKTQEATEAFQVSAGLPVTGVVDAVTNRAAIERGFVPRVGATSRPVISNVTRAMSIAAVDALHLMGPTQVFYTEELLEIEGQRVIARLEPHKHTEGTQLRYWHRGVTLYGSAATSYTPSAARAIRESTLPPIRAMR